MNFIILTKVNKETKDKLFREAVAKFKEYGYDVYVPDDLENSGFKYGFVTNGTKILYFQIDDLFGFQWSIECIPSHETGSGLRLFIDFTNKESVEEAFNTKFGKPYKDFAQFKNRYEKFRSKLIKI